MPLASAVTLQYLAPIFTVIIAYFLLHEHLTPLRMFCFAVAFAGVVLLRVDDLRIGTDYLIIGVVGAMAGGVAYNLVRMLRQTDHPLVVVFYFPIVTLPFALPLALPGWVMPAGWQEWALVLAMGVLTQLAQVYLTKAFQAGTTGTVSIVMYVGAVFALAYGYVFFHETYPVTSLIGMVLVVLGVLLNLFLAVPKRP